MKKLVLYILLAIQGYPAFSQGTGTLTGWPVISKENKPWTRWWWPGSIVDRKDLSTALRKYNDAGLGGVELTVIYGVKGHEKEFIPYLSGEWMKMFTYTLTESGKLGLGVDLSNSSSWPFGGPWVTGEDASKYLTYKKWSLSSHEKLSDTVTCVQKPVLRFNGSLRPDISQIADPVNENNDLQSLAIDQVRFPVPLPLIRLMAFTKNGQVLDLTDKVDNRGILNWRAPEGQWTLYAVFRGWHGKMVERAGPGGEGYVIDHFSEKALRDYLAHYSDAFHGYDITNLRAFFNDSYEVDDASGQADWTPDLPEEFRQRRGYDLFRYLPALFQDDLPEKNAGVLDDYRETVSELLLEKFTAGWTKWAHKEGKITRDQAHGSPGNILDLYSAADIPETEGTDILRMKYATSAANVSGKKLVSAETGTWLGEHFMSTLLDLKKAADKCFTAGVNHIIYHGTCFSPEKEPWPGFLFYASMEITPANTIWTDLPLLNRYIARIQSFSQSSEPDNDILLYYPIHDAYSDCGTGMLKHFDGTGHYFEGSFFKKASVYMEENGYCFDYISDRQLAKCSISDGKIITEGGGCYSTLIVPQCRFMPLASFRSVINMAKKGATIIFYGDLPQENSGWSESDSIRTDFKKIRKSIHFEPFKDGVIKKAPGIAGLIAKSDSLGSLLTYAGIKRESLVSYGLTFNRKKLDGGYCYFICNPNNESFSGWIPLSVSTASAEIFNPMTGEHGRAEIKSSAKGGSLVYARLLPYESLIIKTSAGQVSSERLQYFDKSGLTSTIKGTWKLTFLNGGPSIPSETKIHKTGSWTLLAEKGASDFSGTAVYTINFKRPLTKADAWMLDLGRVCESARVILNGREIAGLIGPAFRVIISDSLLRPVNRLRIKVTNLAANRIAYLDRNNIEWKKFYNVDYPARLARNSKKGLFDASGWKPVESGLIGPVTITPMKKSDF